MFKTVTSFLIDNKLFKLNSVTYIMKSRFNNIIGNDSKDLTSIYF